jgi:hypothetical protein
MQLILVGVVIAFPQTVTVFLDKEKAYDPDAATKMLQNMGVRPEATPSDAPASSSAPAAPEKSEDPMEAVRRALGKDQK